MDKSKEKILERYVNLRCKRLIAESNGDNLLNEYVPVITDIRNFLRPKVTKDIERQSYHIPGKSRKARMTNLYLDKIKQDYDEDNNPEAWDRFLRVYQDAGSPKIVDPDKANIFQKILSKRPFFNPLTKTIHGVTPISDREEHYLDSHVISELPHAFQFQEKPLKKAARFMTRDLPLHINQTIFGGKGPYDHDHSLEGPAHGPEGEGALKDYIYQGDEIAYDNAVDYLRKGPTHDHDHSGYSHDSIEANAQKEMAKNKADRKGTRLGNILRNMM